MSLGELTAPLMLRFRRKNMHKTLAFTLTIAMSGSALAQSTTDVLAKTPYSAYLQDGRGVIVRSNSGLCWRTNYWLRWRFGAAGRQCDCAADRSPDAKTGTYDTCALAGNTLRFQLDTEK